MNEGLGAIYLVLVLVGFVLAVLWICLPFAVFGIKDLARVLIEEQRKTNDLLQKLLSQKQP